MSKAGFYKPGFLSCLIALVALLSACQSLDDNRIPAYRVQINLGGAGLWDSYGVHGFGQYRYFIRQTGTPSNFFYTDNTYTGYGGILLIQGMNPFQNSDVMPLAYDLSCPVECSPDIRVAIDDASLEAVCPVCGSHYNVTVSGGVPVSGPALTGSVKYGLQPYNCIPLATGGYMVTR